MDTSSTKPRTADIPTTTWKQISSLALFHPVLSLTILFWAWKSLLFCIVVGCPGLGYDTSSSLFFQRAGAAHLHMSSGLFKFVRWDSLYFIQIAERDYLFEQEWAFGYGYTRLLSNLPFYFNGTGQENRLAYIAAVGVSISHIAHFLSVLVLHRLTQNVFGTKGNVHQAVSFIAAALHVISPAGVFLSAPYAEPIFSLLNMVGCYTYLSALFDEDAGRCLSRDVKFIVAGITFMAATLVRSNGILSGCLFAYDAALGLAKIVSQGPSNINIRRLCFVTIGGTIVSLGIIGPQYLAYKDYCITASASRPWCKQLIPSVYGWVQTHYWGVGFLKYWTVSNLPLFCVASPMLVLLFQSSRIALTKTLTEWMWPVLHDDQVPTIYLRQSFLVRLAIAQGLLAILAVTHYHVQIINRISSGYPLWYWYIVSLAFEPRKGVSSGRCALFHAVTQIMAVYALVQAVLFGSFLPPA
ncbi:GPI mannosyltransferase 2 [Elaphomyces granulatus]